MRYAFVILLPFWAPFRFAFQFLAYNKFSCGRILRMVVLG